MTEKWVEKEETFFIYSSIMYYITKKNIQGDTNSISKKFKFLELNHV